MSAVTYYVDQNDPVASDLNLGTAQRPWLTIQHAAETLAPGDTVYVRSGTYREQVIPQDSGVVGFRITFAAYPGDSVTIDGSSVALPAATGLFEIVGKSFITVSGFRLVNARSHSDNYGISVEQSSEIVIEDNYIYNTSSSGIIVWSSYRVFIGGNEVVLACNAGAQSENECISVGETDSFEIKDNYVHDGNSVRGEGIDAKDGSSNGSVHGNHVHDVMSVGIYVDAWDKHTHDIDVYGNLVHDIEGDAFSVGSEQGGVLENIRFFNNIAYDCKWVGITVHSCCTSSRPLSNIQIINNTFFHNGWVGSSWGGGILNENSQATGVIIRNNITSQNRSFQIALESGGTGTVDHNLVDGFRSYAGETRGTDFQEGDPQFVAAGAGDFHLDTGSIAIDTGSALAAPSQDFDGVQRPQEAAHDIGAFEHTTCSTLTLSDDTILTATVHEACKILVGPNLAVLPPGDLTLRARVSVDLRDGFSVGTGAGLTVEIDPTVQ